MLLLEIMMKNSMTTMIPLQNQMMISRFVLQSHRKKKIIGDENLFKTVLITIQFHEAQNPKEP